MEPASRRRDRTRGAGSPGRTGSARRPARSAPRPVVDGERRRLPALVSTTSAGRRAGPRRVPAGRGGSSRPSGSTSTIEPRPVAEEDLEPDLVEQVADPVDHLVRVDGRPPGRLDAVVVRAGAGGLEHRVADEGDRLGVVRGAGPPRVVDGPAPRRRTAGAALPPTGSGASGDGTERTTPPTRPSRPRPSRGRPRPRAPSPSRAGPSSRAPRG